MQEPAKAPSLRLHFANGKVIERVSGGASAAYREALRATTGPKRKGSDERRAVAPEDLSPKERQQLVGILAKAFGAKEKSLSFADIFSGNSKKHEVLDGTAETPIEWWDIVDDAKKVRYQLWFYHADCGSLVEAGSTKRVASIIQYGFSVEAKDPGGHIARAMEAAHRDLVKRCPKSELAGADFSVEDDD